jgi:hypothetical protein
MDATTRQVIAFHVGDRSGQSAQALWKKIPSEYQEQAIGKRQQDVEFEQKRYSKGTR